MSQLEVIQECPLCEGEQFNPFIESQDFTVSGEFFNIVSCNQCGFLFTNPRPRTEELDQYYESEEYVSHANSSNSIVNSIYKVARNFTLNWKYKLISKVPVNKTIMDYGCGTGEFLNYCKTHGWEIEGVEPNSKARTQATALNQQAISESLTALNNTTQFEVITLWHVLEHIPDLNETFTQLKNMLAEQGFMLIAVPNCNSYDAQLFKTDWAAYDLPRHLYHFTQNSMLSMMKNHGMEIVEVLPMKLDSYYVSLLSNKIKYGHNKLVKSFINGLYSNSYASKNKEYSSLIYKVRKKNV